jgi:ketosteroid isomerase-like protein
MSHVEDRLAIRELVERFHDAVNHRDFATLGLLFTDDAVWEVAPPFDRRFAGPANIVAGVSESVGRLEFLVQSCSPIVVELQDAAHATARTSMQEFGRFRDGTSMRVAGTYFDAFRKADGTWRFSHRIFRARYAEDTPLAGRIFEDAPTR